MQKRKVPIFQLLLLLFLSVGVIVFDSQAKAATTAAVAATVTAQNISVTATDGSVSYGTIDLSSTADTTNTGVDDSQTATNNGNVTEDFNISGQDSGDWTLAAAAGSEEYTHKFCTATCDASPSWTALTTSYQTLASAVSFSSTQEFDLQIGSPSSTSNYTEQTVSVTVQAVAN